MHFTNSQFRQYDFEDTPCNRDVYLMGKQWISGWEESWLSLFSGRDLDYPGYISYAAVRSTSPEALEVSWYPNISDRFHEVRIVLPRSAFITCVDVPEYDCKPYVFVKDEWLSNLHLSPYSAFALIDAIGVKNALTSGAFSRDKLMALRDRIDAIADATPEIAFISFADSILLKTNWHVGQYNSNIKYSYKPEALLRAIPEIAQAYLDVLGMHIYATVAQGVNEYGDASLTHTSKGGAHISLNSLGLPFAQLQSIDEAAREAIRKGRHQPCDLYIDELFFRSLNFEFDFDKNKQSSATYFAPMSSTLGKYYYISVKTVLDNLKK